VLFLTTATGGFSIVGVACHRWLPVMVDVGLRENQRYAVVGVTVA